MTRYSRGGSSIRGQMRNRRLNSFDNKPKRRSTRSTFARKKNDNKYEGQSERGSTRRRGFRKTLGRRRS